MMATPEHRRRLESAAVSHASVWELVCDLSLNMLPPPPPRTRTRGDVRHAAEGRGLLTLAAAVRGIHF